MLPGTPGYAGSPYLLRDFVRRDSMNAARLSAPPRIGTSACPPCASLDHPKIEKGLFPLNRSRTRGESNGPDRPHHAGATSPLFTAGQESYVDPWKCPGSVATLSAVGQRTGAGSQRPGLVASDSSAASAKLRTYKPDPCWSPWNSSGG